MRRYTFRAFACAGLLALLAAAGLAQNPPAPQPQGPQGEGPHAVGRRGPRMKRGGPDGLRGPRRPFARLNLSDAQREQLRGIESRYADSFRARREELRTIMRARREGGTLSAEQQARARQIHESLRADAERMRAEMRAVLTDEQRTQLQAMREEMKQRREERKLMREGFRERRRQRRQGQPPPPAPPGTNDQL